MDEKFGLITGYECRFVKTDPELIDAIADKIGKSPQEVKGMMRYNIFNIAQFMDLTGLNTSTIRNKIRTSVIDKREGIIGTELDYCFPFKSTKKKGGLYIVRNEKTDKIFNKILSEYREKQETKKQ